MSYEWIRLLHVLAGVGFIATHGASMFVLHSIRAERSRQRIEAILDFTTRTTSATYVTLVAVVGTGAWLGFERSAFFRRGWYWWSLGLLVSTTIWMWFVARPFALKLRAACELRPSGVPRVSDQELAEIVGSGHANLIAAVGVGVTVLILGLMVIQPRSSPPAPDVNDPLPSTTISPVTTLPKAPGATSTTAVPTPTTTRVEMDSLALGRDIYEVSAGGVGCASCHGSDGFGTAEAPGIVGASKSAIFRALDEPAMEDISLTPDELEAVYQYLLTLLP